MSAMIAIRAAAAALFIAGLGTAGNAQAQGRYDQPHEGIGTFYGYSGGGNCSFPPPKGLTAAMNQADYNGSQACGACIAVTNPANGLRVEVRIDDRCPECGVGDVDLDEEAFVKIADRSQGRVPIQWEYIACTPPTLSLYFKEGSNPWWTAIQVRDHRYPVASVAWRPAGGTAPFSKLPREDYNYFVAASGMGDGPYDFKLVDVYGHVIRINQVPLKVGVNITTKKQFPPLGGQRVSQRPVLNRALSGNPPGR
jgi:expansin